MNRKKFLTSTAQAVALPALLNGFSFTAMGASHSNLTRLLRGTDTDHVLVLVQLMGGNDGLNMVIPLDIYSNYYNARTNVAIQQSKVLRLDGTDKSGLHPSMTALQNLFNDGRMNVVQSVGYANPSFSHFQARDIWMSGDNTTLRSARVKTGWMGRYLQEEFPGYPDAYPDSEMPDPLAIQISDVPTLDLQGSIYSMGLSITNPEKVYTFANPFSDYPMDAPPANKELRFLRVVSEKTKIYSDIIRDAYQRASTMATYPERNSLADQLKIVARLIKGGLKTRVYTVTIGGFDTHKRQVNASDTSTGLHAELMKNLSTGIDAFQKDLELMNLDDRVIGMTFSEFGRRIKSNASLGTDHGAAAPLMMFGKHVKKGILGNSPDIPADIQVVNNIPFQYDFRSVYASVLEQWFCVKQPALHDILLQNYQALPLIEGGPCGLPEDIDNTNNNSDKLILKMWPNPYAVSATIQFSTTGGNTMIQQLNSLGQVVKVITNKDYATGTYNIDIYNDNLPAGAYFLRMQNGALQKVISVVRLK
ncbi:DUF1501 domain-containing protein [Ferruginibacter sp. HRS2-29]|uniref:DUF1501 domain-containing protein n=1 Tax=Ferruginibacter sp. HRS2-29 TaxID=2487334 RepID=UPI0020CC41FF|nr:DUF1501 domain-containing protein [Ferruginibacter sp. HRS2-29]MCP9752980.1 DUF1501 domain-containing protein [Ferruginibacter sp. HRS2-29]